MLFFYPLMSVKNLFSQKHDFCKESPKTARVVCQPDSPSQHCVNSGSTLSQLSSNIDVYFVDFLYKKSEWG